MIEAGAAFHLACLFNLVENTTRRSMLLFILANVILLSTNLLGAVPAFFGLYYLFSHVSWFRSKHLALWLLGIVLIATLIVTMQFNIHMMVWQRFIDPTGIDDVLKALGQSDVFIAVAMCALAVLSCWHSDAVMRARCRWITVFAIVLLVSVWVFAKIDGRSVFIPRYFIYLNPYVFFLMTAGIEKFAALSSRRLIARTAPVAIILGFSTPFFHGYNYEKPPWKEIAKTAIEKKVELVLTTNSLGMAVPYYYDAGIDVQALDPSEQTIVQIDEALEDYKVVAVVDNALGGRREYLQEMIKMLGMTGHIYEGIQLSAGLGDELYLFVIYKKQDH
jgi:hypothetical protein